MSRDGNCESRDGNCESSDGNCESRDANCESRDGNSGSSHASCDVALRDRPSQNVTLYPAWVRQES